jgi:hypothetical protein
MKARRKNELPARTALTGMDLYWSRVEKTETCWLWTGNRNPNGYGRFGKPVQYAHRVAYEAMVGPIPDGLTLDHLCRIRHCVNPAHLEPVTAAVNTMRGTSPTVANTKKTHCPAGHPYDERNTAVRGGKRACRECNRQHNRKYREHLRALAG